jgi:hypothetical protein
MRKLFFLSIITFILLRLYIIMITILRPKLQNWIVLPNRKKKVKNKSIN